MLSSKTDVVSRIVDVTPSLESASYALATLIFDNTTEREVQVKRYRITWNGGCFVGNPAHLRIPARSSRQWKVQIAHESGDVQALLTDPAAASVMTVTL